MEPRQTKEEKWRIQHFTPMENVAVTYLKSIDGCFVWPVCVSRIDGTRYNLSTGERFTLANETAILDVFKSGNGSSIDGTLVVVLAFQYKSGMLCLNGVMIYLFYVNSSVYLYLHCLKFEVPITLRTIN